MSRADGEPVPHFFVVPALAGPSSGGTLYNGALLAALERADFPARALHLDAAELALFEGRRGVYWIDTLYLEHFERLCDRNADRRPLGMLMHYLPSLVAHARVVGAEQLSGAETFALSHANAFVAPSEFMRAALAEFDVHERLVGVIEPGRWATGVATRRLEGAAVPRAVLVAQLVPGKGIEPLLRALASELYERDAPLELDIIGGGAADPEYAARCHALVAETPVLSRAVRFVGELPVAGVIEALAQADFLLSASRMESYVMALAEARTLGLPILALSGGNVETLVASVAGGELVRDVPALARAAIGLARTPGELSARRQRAGANALSARTWQQAADEFAAFARELEPHFAQHLT